MMRQTIKVKVKGNYKFDIDKVLDFLDENYNCGWDIYESHPDVIEGSQTCNVLSYTKPIYYGPNGDGHPSSLEHDGLDADALREEIEEATGIYVMVNIENEVI